MRSKMPLYISITLVSAAAIFVVAFMYFRLNRTKIDEEESARYYNRYYAMICDDYASSFWQNVYKGAAEAAEENDAYVELFGSNLNVDYSPEELMEMAISSKVDGIMILGSEQKDKLIEKGIIEVMPLAYMRGRTLSEAFIILDEAQNTTDKQMLMFLTRLGFNSKMIVNGDITQIDLNISRNRSGLVIAREKLSDVKKIGFIEFNNSDVVRNPLVQTIIEKFNGGPVGLETLAAASGEDANTIEDVYEPFLLQLGFIARTPRGRICTVNAYNHLNIPYHNFGLLQ